MTPRRQSRPVAVLIGFMGAGKTTVGRILADRLGVDFIDTDAVIERTMGRTVAQIFADDGEAAFRALEHDVVCDLLAGQGGVIALGGGAVMTPATPAALAGHRVVYLRIDVDQGFARVTSTDRPLLAGPAGPAGQSAERLERYRTLFAQRADTYSGLATIEVDAGLGEPDDVVDIIIAAIAEDARARSAPEVDDAAGGDGQIGGDTIAVASSIQERTS